MKVQPFWRIFSNSYRLSADTPICTHIQKFVPIAVVPRIVGPERNPLTYTQHTIKLLLKAGRSLSHSLDAYWSQLMLFRFLVSWFWLTALPLTSLNFLLLHYNKHTYYVGVLVTPLDLTERSFVHYLGSAPHMTSLKGQMMVILQTEIHSKNEKESLESVCLGLKSSSPTVQLWIYLLRQ